MPRRKAGPRLYLDPARRQFIIRDGTRFVRTGCGEGNRPDAEKALASYIGRKHAPAPSGNPTIDEVLAAYGNEHAPHTARPSDIGYTIGHLLNFWSGKRVTDINARGCRSYVTSKVNGGARRDLEILRAAIRYWHKEYGPLAALPAVTLPPRGQPRERWLTRSEAAKLLWQSRRTEHLKRFILIGLYTGSRSGVIVKLQWDWIDFERGIMRRRDAGEVDKGNKRRPPVRLGTRLLAFLRRWRAMDKAGADALVIAWRGEGIKRLWRSWDKARDRAGLAGITPHVLRHTRATWVMQAGVPIWEAAGHLGMTPTILEKVYGKHSPDFQRRAAEV